MNRKRGPHRLIEAKWIASQFIARVRKGASPRAAANVTKFAFAAFAMKPVRRVQATKWLCIAVDFDQRVRSDIAAAQRQESGRIDVAKVRHEDNAMPVADLKSFVHGSVLYLRS